MWCHLFPPIVFAFRLRSMIGQLCSRLRCGIALVTPSYTNNPVSNGIIYFMPLKGMLNFTLLVSKNTGRGQYFTLDKALQTSENTRLRYLLRDRDLSRLETRDEGCLLHLPESTTTIRV